MSTYKFIKIKDGSNSHEKSDIMFKLEADTLDDIIVEFELFLKACGFSKDLNIDYNYEKDEE